ncbi:hypothetical protein KIN20_013968 [Parelaphostrongylus tenuis]|uniref:Uncharacterized protein n=1 Tax=Parelaphostrongylus tenuis TaxID=148309 RepID=A0AAD5MVB1_PARTN|nr:hypothetical protein KIN20_013968 [Parelaphostrongylus tenuis]
MPAIDLICGKDELNSNFLWFLQKAGKHVYSIQSATSSNAGVVTLSNDYANNEHDQNFISFLFREIAQSYDSD